MPCTGKPPIHGIVCLALGHGHGEELGQLAIQDKGHANGGDDPDGEDIEPVEPGGEGIVPLHHLVPDGAGADLPTHQQGHDQSAQGHGHALGNEVHKVQPGGGQVPSRLMEGDPQSVGPQAVHRDQGAHGHDGQADQAHNAAAVGLMALQGGVVQEEGDHDLGEGDGGGDGAQAEGIWYSDLSDRR